MKLPAVSWFPPFEPHRWLVGGHRMTIAAYLAERVRGSRPRHETRRIFHVDDATKVLGVCSWRDDRHTAPTLVLAHGLTGDADAVYMRLVAHKAFAAGFNVVRLNTRNCGGTEGWTPELYHTGLTEDLRAVVEELISQDGLQRIYLGGFSMGANMVLKLAGEWGADTPAQVRGLAAISPPIQLAQASKAINTGFVNGLYQRNFLASLTSLVESKSTDHPGRYDAGSIAGIRSLRDYDDRFIAPNFGFADADDYYAQASSGPWLEHIRIPALVVHARDDSLIPFEPFEGWIAKRPDNVLFLTPRRGGHVGFIGRRPAVGASWRDTDRHWAENRIVQWFHWLESSK